LFACSNISFRTSQQEPEASATDLNRSQISTAIPFNYEHELRYFDFQWKHAPEASATNPLGQTRLRESLEIRR
jgi:hypothetical protein